MPDNITLDSGSGGETLATDLISGVQHQRVKVQHGADGSATDVSAASPMPTRLGDGTDQIVVSAAGALLVDIGSAIPAGTNAIGKLAANSGVDIGDVDVTSIIPGSGATNLGKAEDAIHASGDVGVMMLGVRRAADTPTSGSDGDYEPLKLSADGHLKCEIFTGGDTFAISAASLPLPSGAATNAAQLADGHNVTIDNGTGGAAVNIQDGGNAITVDWAGTAPPIGAGVEATALRVTLATDSTGVLSVDDNGSSLTVDNADITTIAGAVVSGQMQVDIVADGAGLALAANQLADGHNVTIDNASVPVAGAVAHDAAASGGNPVLGGLEARTTTPAAVADADLVRAQADDQGRQVVILNAPRELVTQNRLAIVNTNETTIIAQLASTFRDLTHLTLSNEDTVDVRVDIRDDTGGTVVFSVFLAANGGGAVMDFSTPWKQTAINDNWTAQLSTGTGPVYVMIQTVDRL